MAAGGSRSKPTAPRWPDLRPSFGYVQGGDGVHPIERDLITEETLAARVLAAEHRLYPAAVRLALAGELAVAGRRVRRVPPR